MPEETNRGTNIRTQGTNNELREIKDWKMPGGSRKDLRTAELDPDLLATPYTFQTKWHVITGASCSGKTTLIEQLAGVGFRTVPEIGRQYFERELAKGRAIEEIRQDPAANTRQIFDMNLEILNGLRTDEVLFLDRGLPDCLTFFRVNGLDPNEILPECFRHRYASVFMLDRFPYKRDGVRSADDATAAYYDSWISRDYDALGYKVVRVPVMPPEERLAFVLERLPE
jgi:predicted ATPase